MFKEIIRIIGVIYRRRKRIKRLKYEYSILDKVCDIYSCCKDCPFTTVGNTNDCPICHERGLITDEIDYYKEG